MGRTVGELILARLSAMGSTQADLVRELARVGASVTKQSVNQWCVGTARPSMGHLLAVWQVLGVSPDDRQSWLDAMAQPRRLEEDDIPTEPGRYLDESAP